MVGDNSDNFAKKNTNKNDDQTLPKNSQLFKIRCNDDNASVLQSSRVPSSNAVSKQLR